MSAEFNLPATPHLKRISRALSILVLFTSTLVLMGWMAHNELLKRLLPDAVAMNPLSAICFLLCTCSIWMQHDEIHHPEKLKYARMLALVAAIIGLIKFISVLTRFNFYLDTVLFHHQLWDPVRNDLNRMAPNTAFCFFLTGVSLMWLDKEVFHGRRPAQYFSILIMFVAILSLYGYVYGVRFLYGVAHYIPMSIITAFNFLFLSIALLFARPEKGTMSIIIGDTSSEVTLLRLAAFIVPLAMGWLKLKGEELGYYKTEFGTALFAIVTYALAMFLLGRRSVLNYRLRMVRKKATDELQKAHDNFFKFFHLSPEIKTISEVETGKFLYVNKAFEYFYEIKAGDVIGKTSIELKLLTPDQRAEIARSIKEKGMGRGVEMQIRNGKGEFKEMFMDIEIIELEDKKYFLTSQLDITPRKKAERELQQSEQLLNSIVNSVGEGLVVVNTKGKYLVVNHFAEQILKQRPAQIELNELASSFGLFYPDTVTPFPSDQTTVARSLKGLETDELELFIRNANIPEGKFLISTGRPIKDKEGNIIAAVSVFRDDTKRRQLQLLLNETDHKLKEVIRSVGEGVVMCDAEGKFILFNKKAEELIGKGALNIPPDQWSATYHIYHPDGSRLFNVGELLLMRALKGEIVENARVMIRNQSAEIERHLLVSARPVKGQHHEIIAAIANFKDISEMKHMEQLLTEIQDKYNQLMKR